MEGQASQSPGGGVRQQQQAVSGDTLFSLGRFLQASDAGDDQSPQNLSSQLNAASSQQAAAASSNLFGTSPPSIAAALGNFNNPQQSFLSGIATTPSESPLLPPITPAGQPQQRAESLTTPSSAAAAPSSQPLNDASSEQQHQQQQHQHQQQHQQQQQQQQQHSLLTRKPSLETQHQIPSSVATLYQMSHQGPLKNVSVSRNPQPGPGGTHNKSQPSQASTLPQGNYPGFETALGSQILVAEQPPSPNTSQLVLCEGPNCGALLEVKHGRAVEPVTAERGCAIHHHHCL